MIPVSWTFRRNSMMPIIDARGESPVKEGISIMVQKAIEMIKKASEFEGVPYQNPPSPSNTSSLTVSFSLIFPSDKELTNYMETIQQRE